MQNVVLISKEELERLIVNTVQKYLQGSTSPGKHQKDFIAIEEAADFLQLAKATLYSMVSQRRIPFYKNGKKLYFKQSELTGWLSSSKHKSISELKKDLEEGKEILPL